MKVVLEPKVLTACPLFKLYRSIDNHSFISERTHLLDIVIDKKAGNTNESYDKQGSHANRTGRHFVASVIAEGGQPRLAIVALIIVGSDGSGSHLSHPIEKSQETKNW